MDFLACAWREAAGTCRHEIAWLPRSLLQEACGNLLPLFEQAQQTEPEGPLLATPWPPDERRASLRALLAEHDGELAPLLQLLAAALDERGLLLDGQSRSTRGRIALVQGLMALLPANARALLGFASNVDEICEDAPAILFSDAKLNSARRRAGEDLALPSTPGGHYVALLAQCWDGDERQLLAAIDTLGPLPPGSDLATGLDQLAQHHLLARRIRNGQTVPADELKSLLGSGLPLAAPLLPAVLQRLLDEALPTAATSRPPASSRSTWTPTPALDRQLGATLAKTLQQRPDAVYVFARARLADSDECPQCWRQRLQAAALCSLQIAICEADAATVVNWLRLIAREPADYGLARILEEGLLAVRERAHSDSGLALELLELALHHAPNALEVLLADEMLLAALPDNIGLVAARPRRRPPADPAAPRPGILPCRHRARDAGAGGGRHQQRRAGANLGALAQRTQQRPA